MIENCGSTAFISTKLLNDSLIDVLCCLKEGHVRACE